jgi:hypothetical protein
MHMQHLLNATRNICLLQAEQVLRTIVKQALSIAEQNPAQSVQQPHTRSSLVDENRKKYPRVVPAIDVFALASDLVEIELRAAPRSRDPDSARERCIANLDKLLELAQSQRRFECLRHMCERICAGDCDAGDCDADVCAKKSEALSVLVKAKKSAALSVLVKLASIDESKLPEVHLFPMAEELQRQHESVRSKKMHRFVLSGLFGYHAKRRTFAELFRLCDEMSAPRNHADSQKRPRAAVFTGEDGSLDSGSPRKWLEETLAELLHDEDDRASGPPIEWVYRFMHGSRSARQASDSIDESLRARPAACDAKLSGALKAISAVLKEFDSANGASIGIEHTR